MDTNVFRREMHRHPEMPFKEVVTRSLIESELTDAGIYYSSLDGYGIVARIEGQRGDNERCVVLHSYIGAMAVEERTGVEFASEEAGCMHACGNDVHAAVLLGVLRRMQASPDFEGTLLALFQSGDGIRSGSLDESLKPMLFADYKVAAVINGFVDDDMEVGEIGFCPGRYMASLDRVHFCAKGIGGPAACYSRVKDPVVAIADLIMRLNALNSDVCVVAVGSVTANGSEEHIPDKAECGGVMRMYDEKLRQRMKDMIAGAVQEIEYRYDIELEASFDAVAHTVENDKQLSYEAMLLASSNGFAVKDLNRSMGVSAFGSYAQSFPSLMYRVGVGRTSGSMGGSAFVPDERALAVAEEFMYQLALNNLNR